MEIEEAIKILNDFKKNGYIMLMLKYDSRNKANSMIEQAIETVLKELNNSISKDKIKDKMGKSIEVLENRDGTSLFKVDIAISNIIKIYKELLEKE